MSDLDDLDWQIRVANRLQEVVDQAFGPGQMRVTMLPDGMTAEQFSDQRAKQWLKDRFRQDRDERRKRWQDK